MTNRKTSRRRFVQLVGGAALALRHGWLPAQTPKKAARVLAQLADSSITLEWDGNFLARVSRVTGNRRTPMTSWNASEYLLRADGRHMVRFRLFPPAPLDTLVDANGRGTRLTLSGVSDEGIHKIMTATVYQRYPGFAVLQVSYRNESSAAIALTGWTNADFSVLEPAATAPGFWCYSGASYEDRRDWVQAVPVNFEQDNFLGMEASDYGGGTPIVDVWHRAGGLAVGHVEMSPKLVSLPVHAEHGRVRMAVCSRGKSELAAGETLRTLETFVSVHERDHFATLNTYRQVMADRGLRQAVPGPGSYESIWCAWGYERECTTALIEGTLPKVSALGLKWAVIDDGWQAAIGDWRPHPKKYPNGEADLRKLVSSIRTAGLKPRLWYSPLSVAPGADLLHDHADMLLLDKEGAVQKISWWNSFYLCPAYDKTVTYTAGLVRQFIGDWKFAGLKIDGQHLNGVPPCFNPAHHHADPNESVEGLQNLYHTMFEAAIEIDPDAVMELCPCGTAYSVYNFPSMNQAPASDPESSWQVRLKAKSLKALMGPSAPFAGDHVELSDHADDFASTVGVGGVVSTKFTWPVDPKPKDSFLLTPEKERLWRRWIALYQEKMLPLGTYLGELYDIGFDEPETHAIQKAGKLYYALFAKRWRGEVSIRGLAAGIYRVRDYFNDQDLGRVSASRDRLPVAFEGFLLLEATPA